MFTVVNAAAPSSGVLHVSNVRVRQHSKKFCHSRRVSMPRSLAGTGSPPGM